MNADTLLSIAFSALTATAAGAIVWGSLREKVTRLESDNREMREKLDRFQSDFVSHIHFQSIIDPIREDIKQILSILINQKGETNG